MTFKAFRKRRQAEQMKRIRSFGWTALGFSGMVLVVGIFYWIVKYQIL